MSKVRFICTAYPFYRVLIARGGNPVGGDYYAEFKNGSFETDDLKAIEVLQATPFVYQEQEIDKDVVPIVMTKNVEEEDAETFTSGKAMARRRISKKVRA